MFSNVSNDNLILLGKYTLLWNAFERNFFNFFGIKCYASYISTYSGNVEITYKIKSLSEELKAKLLSLSGNPQAALIALNFGNGKTEINLSNRCEQWLNDDSFNLIAVFGALYRIRCNTFHGNKEYISFAEQYDLFVIIINLLEAFLESVNANLDMDRI